MRQVGKSKAVLSLQETALFKRAVLFTLLNPQKNGACFAGMRKVAPLNLENYKSINLKIRGQGQFKGYKVVLRQPGGNYSFCNFFEVYNYIATSFCGITCDF